MLFDMKLTFTGLCVLVYNGGTQPNPANVSIILANAKHSDPAHNHVPRMVYRAKDLLTDDSTSQITHQLFPNEMGEDLAVLELSGDILVEDPTGKGFHAPWSPPQPEPNPGEEESLVWLPSIYELNKNLGVPRPDPAKHYHGLTNVVAAIELKGGALSAGDLTRDKSGAYVLAEFVDKAGGGGGTGQQVLADKLHLEITGITDSIKISSANWDATFQPAPQPGHPTGTGKVEIAITNLPDKSPPGLPPARLEHFGHYYDMFLWSHGKPDLRLPKLLGQVATGSSSVCPPTRYD